MARYGAIVVVIVVVIVVIVVATGGKSNNPPAAQSAADVNTVPIPASMHLAPDPATTPGDEGIPLAKGPVLATLANAATGQTVQGVKCQAGEQLVEHVHSHLTIFVNGQSRAIPYGIGIPGAEAVQTAHGPFVETGSCFYWLHSHQADGIIHVESPSLATHFTLGQFFAEWGIPLNANQVGPAKGKVTTFFTAPGKKVGIYRGNPANLPLGNHYQIQLNVGTPIVKPIDITKWGNL